MDHAWIIRTGENGNRGSNYDDPILTWIIFIWTTTLSILIFLNGLSPICYGPENVAKKCLLKLVEIFSGH